MSKHLNTAATVIFCFLTVILITKAMAIARETAAFRQQTAARSNPAHLSEVAAEVLPYEMVTVQQAIRGVAWHYRLPLDVQVQKNILKISVTKGKEPEQAKPKYEVLHDFDAMMGFLSAVSTMPYRLEFKELCVGTDCENGFSATAEVKNINAAEKPAS